MSRVYNFSAGPAVLPEEVLKEAAAAKWLTKETLDSVEWLPADITLIEKIKQSF